MIVEPSDGTRFITEYTLMNRGYEVFSYSDADVALQNLESVAPDLIITDYSLSSTDGFTFIERVRQNTNFATVKCILLSIKTDADVMKHAGSLMVNEVLRKPFTATTLNQGVEKAIYEDLT